MIFSSLKIAVFGFLLASNVYLVAYTVSVTEDTLSIALASGVLIANVLMVIAAMRFSR